MPQFITGGRKNFQQQQNVPQQDSQYYMAPIRESYEHEMAARNPQQQEDSEGWNPYLHRNIHLAPYRAGAAAESMFGLGNLAEQLTKHAPLPEPLYSGLRTAQRWAIPSTEQAEERYAYLDPEYAKLASEAKPSDWAFKLATQDIPAAVGPALLAGIGTVPAALLGLGAGYLGAQGGRPLGSEIGGVLGSLAGKEEAGREIGGELGEFGGGLLGAGLAHGAMNRPSKAIPPTLEELHDFVMSPERKRFEPIITQLEKEVGEHAAKAEQLASSKEGPYKSVRAAMNKSLDQMTGLPATDEAAIMKISSDLDKKAGGTGKLSLEEAKIAARNINGRWDDISDNGRQALYPLKSSLDKFIKEVGGEAHNNEWMKFKEKTKQYIAIGKAIPKYEAQNKKINAQLAKYLGKPGLIGIGGYLGYSGLNKSVIGGSLGALAGKALTQVGSEMSTLIRAFKNNPALAKSYTNEILKLSGLSAINAKSTARRLDALGKKLEVESNTVAPIKFISGGRK